MTREMGKVLAETRGDVQEAIDEAFYVAGEGRRLFGVRPPPASCQNKFAMSVRMPVGVVGLITPWNFPMAIPSWKLFPALVCRQHLRHQAGHRHAALHLQPGPDPGRCRPAAGRGQHRLRHRLRRGHAAGRASRRARHQLHRFQRGRLAGRASAPPPPSSRSRSKWAARTRRSCSTTPTSIWPSTARCGAPSAPPASAARPPAASCCRRESPRSSPPSLSPAPRSSRSATVSTNRSKSARRSTPARSKPRSKYVEIALAEGAKLLCRRPRAHRRRLRPRHLL